MRHGDPLAKQFEETIRVYRRCTGLDPGTARAEVDRIGRQLMGVQYPSEWLGQVEPGLEFSHHDVDADALTGYYLRGRRTDDPLLVDVLARWADYEDLNEQIMGQVIDRGLSGVRAGTALHGQLPTLGRHYLEAWQAWLARGV